MACDYKSLCPQDTYNTCSLLLPHLSRTISWKAHLFGPAFLSSRIGLLHVSTIGKSSVVLTFQLTLNPCIKLILCRYMQDLASRTIWHPLEMCSWSFLRVTGPLWGKSIGDRWIPLTKISNVEFWYRFDIGVKKLLKKTMELPVMRGAIMRMWRHCNEWYEGWDVFCEFNHFDKINATLNTVWYWTALHC